MEINNKGKVLVIFIVIYMAYCAVTTLSRVHIASIKHGDLLLYLLLHLMPGIF